MRRLFLLYSLVVCLVVNVFSQVDTVQTPALPDSVLLMDTVAKDTVNPGDTIRLVRTDTAKARPIDQPIDYSAEDSIYFDLDSMITYLYSGVQLESEKMVLQAGKIAVNLKKSELEAYPRKDSAGKVIEKPVFSDGNDEFVARYLKYNFKTKKGYARQVKTEQSEGFLHGGEVKIFPDGVTNIKQGKFTTCDLDHPHYYIAFTKAKYVPKKSIITGFSYFVIEDIPFPIFLPFGYFPQRQYNSSGIIAPTFHQEQLRGYGLVGGGYYFAINDYVDLKVTGDIFSKGSWGITLASNYNVRYKFSGNFKFSYSHITNGEPYLIGSFVKNTYSINLTYRQSPKANPTSNFSVSINLDKGNNRQFNATDITQFANNTTASSVSYQKRFRGLPLMLSVNANLSQNLSQGTISGSLPNITLNLSRVMPFKNLGHNSRAWYRDIGFSVNSSFVNSFSNASDSVFFANPFQIIPLMRNGYRYTIPVSKSFKIFKYFNLSTSFNYTGRVYFSQIRKHIEFVDSQYQVVTDTIYRVKHFMDFSASAALSTNLYGIFRINKFGLKAIRHKLTPSISFVYKPDFGSDFWGYYLPEPDDTTGTRYYSIVPYSVVGFPSRGLQQSINFGVNNNFEAKIFSKKDTVKHEKKITLIDNLSIRGSYNFAADSLNFSRITLNANTSVFGSRINFSTTFNPYAINENGVMINVFEFQQTGKLLRLEQMRLTASYSIDSKKFKKNKQPKQGNEEQPNTGYVPYHYFDPQWSLSTNYTFSLTRRFNTYTQTFDIELRQILNFRFDITPTPYWKFGLESGYDFDKMQLTSTTFRVYRDLHCWEMSLQVTPFGRMRGYYFTLRIKSPMFNFIQIKKQRSWHDNSIYY